MTQQVRALIVMVFVICLDPLLPLTDYTESKLKAIGTKGIYAMQWTVTSVSM